MSAQDLSKEKDLLNRTEVAIYKAQKEMMAGNASKQSNEFSLAVKYQVLAVESFKSNNIQMAICYSSKAREYAVAILSGLGHDELKYYFLTSDDLALVTQNNCSTQIINIQSGILEESVISDPGKLSTDYKISIN